MKASLWKFTSFILVFNKGVRKISFAISALYLPRFKACLRVPRISALSGKLSSRAALHLYCTVYGIFIVSSPENDIFCETSIESTVLCSQRC
jgi:hypothetical protein